MSKKLLLWRGHLANTLMERPQSCVLLGMAPSRGTFRGKSGGRILPATYSRRHGAVSGHAGEAAKPKRKMKKSAAYDERQESSNLPLKLLKNIISALEAAGSLLRRWIF